MQATRRLMAGLTIAAGLAATPAIAMASAPPPIEDIAAQYLTETGATYISCAPYPEQTICYGLDASGAPIASTWVDGTFTPVGAVDAAVSTDSTESGFLASLAEQGVVEHMTDAKSYISEFTDAVGNFPSPGSGENMGLYGPLIRDEFTAIKNIVSATPGAETPFGVEFVTTITQCETAWQAVVTESVLVDDNAAEVDTCSRNLVLLSERIEEFA